VKSPVDEAGRRCSGKAAEALLRELEAEDATDDPDELARRERTWRAFREAMNHSHRSDRILYP